MTTLRQQIIKDIARRIDKWNWPIWEAAAMNKQNYSVGEDCLIEQVEINSKIESVKKFPIYWSDDNGIWSQAEEYMRSYGYYIFLDSLTPRAEKLLIADIRKILRYKMVRS